MAEQRQTVLSHARSPYALEGIQTISSHTFTVPTKRINDGNDLDFFFRSTAYRDLMSWLLQLDRAMFPSKLEDGQIKQCRLDSSPPLSVHIQGIQKVLTTLSNLMQSAPPETGPRRFGNVAFRAWFQLAESNADSLLRESLREVLETSQDHLIDELKSYLLGGFGSAQRLDYGTGHELSFLAFLGCLWKLGVFAPGEEQAIVVGILQPYLQLVRQLIMTYTLEPAGSHGVWGLDDHSFLPYIFGSAQLGPAISKDDMSQSIPTEGSLRTAPKPASVTDKSRVADYKDSNMYFAAIQFIYDVKRGPFWEHSPVLYDVSGIKDGWGKINKGMLKMYAAEVLGKFPVVQHFPFGSLFEWKKDPNAEQAPTTLHAQNQPAALRSKDAPPVAASGTKAPWIDAGSSVAETGPRTGMPSLRAPWAASGASVGLSAASHAGLPTTAAPWAGGGAGQSTRPSTAAPWAKRDAT